MSMTSIHLTPRSLMLVHQTQRPILQQWRSAEWPQLVPHLDLMCMLASMALLNCCEDRRLWIVDPPLSLPRLRLMSQNGRRWIWLDSVSDMICLLLSRRNFLRLVYKALMYCAGSRTMTYAVKATCYLVN